jgi:hypothetical protein
MLLYVKGIQASEITTDRHFTPRNDGPGVFLQEKEVFSFLSLDIRTLIGLYFYLQFNAAAWIQTDWTETS